MFVLTGLDAEAISAVENLHDKAEEDVEGHRKMFVSIIIFHLVSKSSK